MEPPQTQTPPKTTTTLTREVVLVSLNVSWLKGQYVIESAQVKLEDEELQDDVATRPRWKMMPEDWKSKFSKLERKARLAIEAYGVPFGIRGLQVIPRGMLSELFEKLGSIRQDFNELAAEFAQEFPAILAAFEKKVGPAAFEQYRSKLPTAAGVLGHFSIRYPIVPIVLGENTGQSSLATILEGQAARQLVNESREQMDDIIRESLEVMVRRPREELSEAVQHLADSLEQEKVVKQATLDKVARTFRKYRSFDFLADEQLLSVMAQVERRLEGHGATDINSLDPVDGQNLSRALRQLAAISAEESRLASAVRENTRSLLL